MLQWQQRRILQVDCLERYFIAFHGCYCKQSLITRKQNLFLLRMQASKKVKVGGIILLNANKILVKLLKFHNIEKLTFENVQKKSHHENFLPLFNTWLEKNLTVRLLWVLLQVLPWNACKNRGTLRHRCNSKSSTKTWRAGPPRRASSGSEFTQAGTCILSASNIEGKAGVSVAISQIDMYTEEKIKAISAQSSWHTHTRRQGSWPQFSTSGTRKTQVHSRRDG